MEDAYDVEDESLAVEADENDDEENEDISKDKVSRKPVEATGPKLRKRLALHSSSKSPNPRKLLEKHQQKLLERHLQKENPRLSGSLDLFWICILYPFWSAVLVRICW